MSTAGGRAQLEQLARSWMEPRSVVAAVKPNGTALLRSERGVLVRPERLRLISRSSSRAASGEGRTPTIAGLERLDGPIEVVVDGADEMRLLPVALDLHEPVRLRSALLLVAQAGVAIAAVRTVAGVVELRGPGEVVLEVPRPVAAHHVQRGRELVLRGPDLLAWMGDLEVRAVAAADAPGGVPGLVAFVGDGLVLVDGAPRAPTGPVRRSAPSRKEPRP